MPPKSDRFPELDALRGIAVWMMVGYHLLFDLAFFHGWDIPVSSGILKMFAQGTATLFLFLVGICFAISWERASTRRGNVTLSEAALNAAESKGVAALAQHDNFLSLYSKYRRRGLTIFAGGMLVSLATWLIAPEAFVKFGILHLIGVSTLFLPFFALLGPGNLLLGLLIILAAPFFPAFLSSPALPPYLFPLGFPYPGFSSLDYYPLIPWLGVILAGVGLGKLLYTPDPRLLTRQLQRAGSPFYYPLLLWSGRRSLWIYFLHQPVILLFLQIIL